MKTQFYIVTEMFTSDTTKHCGFSELTYRVVGYWKSA